MAEDKENKKIIEKALEAHETLKKHAEPILFLSDSLKYFLDMQERITPHLEAPILQKAFLALQFSAEEMLSLKDSKKANVKKESVVE